MTDSKRPFDHFAILKQISNNINVGSTQITSYKSFTNEDKLSEISNIYLLLS